MFLYHGTDARKLTSIIEHGLRPKGYGTLTRGLEHNPNAVFLTSVYPFMYGLDAINKNDIDKTLLILKINISKLKQELLIPDDELYVRTLVRSGNDWRTACAESRKMTHCINGWKESIAKHGSCAYLGTIGMHAVDTIAFVNVKKQNSWVAALTLSGFPSPEQFTVHKNRLTNAVEWLFTDNVHKDFIINGKPMLRGFDVLLPKDRDGICIFKPYEAKAMKWLRKKSA